MLLISTFLNYELPLLLSKTGFKGFDIFRYVTESFSKTNAAVGLMIMSIGGFVAYIDKIGNKDAISNNPKPAADGIAINRICPSGITKLAAK